MKGWTSKLATRPCCNFLNPKEGGPNKTCSHTRQLAWQHITHHIKYFYLSFNARWDPHADTNADGNNDAILTAIAPCVVSYRSATKNDFPEKRWRSMTNLFSFFYSRFWCNISFTVYCSLDNYSTYLIFWDWILHCSSLFIALFQEQQ